MSFWARVLFLATVVAALLALSCNNKKSSPTAPPDNGNEVPQGMVRITGSVHDTSGAAVSGVALHVVYDLTGPARTAMDPMIPAVANFYDADQLLTTECGGQTSIADGVPVKIFWDRNANGPDGTDPQPPLCADPPECSDGTPGTVNENQFPMNGTDAGLGPGLFYANPGFATIGDTLSPSLFYLRIYCADGNVLYTSQVVHLLGGLVEVPMHFTCTQCNGAPGIPEWRMDAPYPNPATDSVTVSFNLLDNAYTVLSLVWPNGTQTDSVVKAQINSGLSTRAFRLGTSPNGLYTLKLQAGSYQSQAALLKNVTDNNLLRSTSALTQTANDGAFTFQTAAGVAIQKRGAGGEDQGSVTLGRVKLVALKSGYQVADTTFAVASQQTYNVNLTVRPQ